MSPAGNGQLDADTKRYLHQLIKLVEISLTLNSTKEPEELLQSIIQTATDLLDCEAASILLYEKESNQLHFAAATGTDPHKLAEIPVPGDQSIAGVVFREKRAVFVPDVSDDPRHYDQVGEEVQFRPRNLLGVPMLIRDQVTGVLEALNKKNGPFTKDDSDILSIIASQAAVAIQNARQMQALQNAYAEIRRADDAKTRFLALASHELRTPLQHVLGYAGLLIESEDQEVIDKADRVVKAANRMKSIIESMTSLDLIRQGKMEAEFKLQSLQPLLEKALQEKRHDIIEHRHLVEWHVPMHPIMIKADEKALTQVFINLLDNAIRFTPDNGQISIEAKAKKDSVMVSITDNGIGIPAGELENIFKDFYQLEQHLTRTHEGLGLGLTVARGIVSLHGGKIWVESDGEGSGSIFCVSLPLSTLPSTGTLKRIVAQP
jgi:K+-sensing histidine kinase KdpD